VINPVDTVVVRQIQGEAEIQAFHELVVSAFSDVSDLAAAGLRERAELEEEPDFHPRLRRGAFRGATMVGGYTLLDRWLRVGSSYLSTGCIGGVGTGPDYRLQGVASALMNDAIAEADVREHALLLLTGIPNFYHRFGYTDVVELSEQVIERTAVPAEAPEGVRVRVATAADVSALLAIYERHFSSYTGCFTRTIEQQALRLRRGLESDNPPFLALDAAGNARGYLIVSRGRSLARAREVAADTWPVAAALLRHHAELLAATLDLTSDITWPLPPDSPTVYHLADNLEVADTSTWGNPTRAWAIRSQTYYHRRAGWLGRLVSLRRTLESLRPVWHSRLARASPGWAGAFVLTVGDESAAVEVGDGVVEVLDAAPPGAPRVTIAPDRFIQLVWGYRPVAYVASQPGTAIPRELERVLDVLFPPGHAWIPGSDRF
jgi:predicted N-acetyltransferase YhbS